MPQINQRDEIAQLSFVRGGFWNKTMGWVADHPKWVLALAVFIALGPFLTKPFNIDDPLFIWTARQIHAHPLNPYGFNVNWYGTTSPMWKVTENPPLAAYYLALAAGVLGWSEISLHAAFLLPALAVILGTYRLARHFCEAWMLAALVTLFTPVFLVSSTTVMCDVLMLAFWVWAMVLWIEGMEHDAFWLLAGAGVLIALAALTKYFGVCLIPLLAVYSMMSKRRIGGWVACLMIPLLALGVWHWATQKLYGQDLFLQAADFARGGSGFFSGARVNAAMTGLTFTGGCLAPAVFMAPWLWLRRTGSVFQWRKGWLFLPSRLWRLETFLIAIGGALLLAVALLYEEIPMETYGWIKGWSRLSAEVQILFWTAGGVSVLALTVADVWKRRDARSWLLALWVFGTFVFTTVFNWTINGRSILPMAPALGILLARRLQERAKANENTRAVGRSCMIMTLAVSALFAFLVAWSDFVFAAAVRHNALQTHERYGRSKQTLWFQGHWGFQFYMAELGDHASDSKQRNVRPGDFMAVPLNNTNVEHRDTPDEELDADGPWFLTDMNRSIGASFYSSLFGPLPFAFGHVTPGTCSDLEAPSLTSLDSGFADPSTNEVVPMENMTLIVTCGWRSPRPTKLPES